ncbi:MAG: hypothetical protein KDI88_06760 [Gammaproteobacteria bacterium]|nr:hypothetical protein [Gammaproteobacteria bacterium]
MTNKLVQKHLFRGTHEYEIDGEQLNVRVKTRFKEEKLSIMLTVLNPEPVIDKSSLAFVSRVNGEPLVSLMLAKPDPKRFNAFVSELKQRALAEYNAFSGLLPTSLPEGMAANSYDEPPEFDDDGDVAIAPGRTVRVDEVETAIRMLQTHLDPDQTSQLVAALEALREAPDDHGRLTRVAQVFSEMGGNQGAVLTYAPYLAILMSDDPFNRV